MTWEVELRFVFVLWKKKVNKLCFPSIFKVQTLFAHISRSDKHAELLKIYFKQLVKKLDLPLHLLNLIWGLKFIKSGKK